MKWQFSIGCGTLMGTGFGLLPIIPLEDGFKTAILASIGALVSFVLTSILHLLKAVVKNRHCIPFLKQMRRPKQK